MGIHPDLDSRRRHVVRRPLVLSGFDADGVEPHQSA
jgi:hypothetical protein